jgi:hypothetical protein
MYLTLPLTFRGSIPMQGQNEECRIRFEWWYVGLLRAEDVLRSGCALGTQT